MTFPLMAEALAETPSCRQRAGFKRPLRVLAVDDEPMMNPKGVRMLKPSRHLSAVAVLGRGARKTC